MATIERLRLEIFENNGAALARVTYQVRPSQQDAQHRYREDVQLIGVDEGPGEDGTNELIVGGLLFSGIVTFPSTALVNRERLLPLPSSALDEDRGTGPAVFFALEDELRARVTLTEIPGTPVLAESNLVRRGGLVIKDVALPG